MPHPRKMPISNLTAYIVSATEGNKGLLLTDQELFHDINRQATQEERISYRTFQRYRTAAMTYGEEYLHERHSNFNQSYQDLYDALMDNRIKQKLNLFDKMMNAEPNDSRNYKWIMERKFPDLNLRVATQKALGEHEMYEVKNQIADLQDMDAEYKRFTQQQKRKELEAYVMERSADLVQQDAEEEESYTETEPTPQAVMPRTTATPSGNTTQNYSDLWTRPDGSRRTKEQFVRAVKAAKAGR